MVLIFSFHLSTTRSRFETVCDILHECDKSFECSYSYEQTLLRMHDSLAGVNVTSHVDISQLMKFTTLLFMKLLNEFHTTNLLTVTSSNVPVNLNITEHFFVSLWSMILYKQMNMPLGQQLLQSGN